MRVTHIPTGETVTVQDQAATEDIHRRALSLLRASLSWDRARPWTASAHSLVLWTTERHWRYSIHNEAGILDGNGLGDIQEFPTTDEAQATLLVRDQVWTGLTYVATWSTDRPNWWHADLLQVTLS